MLSTFAFVGSLKTYCMRDSVTKKVHLKTLELHGAAARKKKAEQEHRRGKTERDRLNKLARIQNIAKEKK